MLVCETERLTIRRLNFADAGFIVQLLNEEDFIRYIADKNVRNNEQAKQYLLDGPMASYNKYAYGLYLVELKATKTAIGICGLLKRDELNHPDLGFAFLAQYCGKGYALEAVNLLLSVEMAKHALTKVIAITMPENVNSNHLLKKAGFNQTGMVELYDSQNNLYQYLAK